MPLIRAASLGSLLFGIILLMWGIKEHKPAFTSTGVPITIWASVMTLWAYVPGLRKRWEAHKADGRFMRRLLLVEMLAAGVALLIWGFERDDRRLLVTGGLLVGTPLPVTMLVTLSRQHLVRTWQALAEQTGSIFEKDPLYVAGAYRGRAFRLDRPLLKRTFGGRPYEVPVLRVVLSVNNRSHAQMRLTRRLGPWHSGRGIRIGDSTFDRHFIVEGKPANFVLQSLAFPSLRTRLAQINAQDIQLSGQLLYYQARSLRRSVESLGELLNVLCDLAEAIETYSR